MSKNTSFKIARPSKAEEARLAVARANAAKLTGDDDGRLSVRMPKEAVRAIHIAALKSGKKIKAFVLDACRAAGAEIPDTDG
jgi:predicted HicB family RNase H-like nuclease